MITAPTETPYPGESLDLNELTAALERLEALGMECEEAQRGSY